MEEEIVNNRERDLADELLAACVLFCLWPPVSLQRLFHRQRNVLPPGLLSLVFFGQEVKNMPAASLFIFLFLFCFENKRKRKRSAGSFVFHSRTWRP